MMVECGNELCQYNNIIMRKNETQNKIFIYPLRWRRQFIHECISSTQRFSFHFSLVFYTPSHTLHTLYIVTVVVPFSKCLKCSIVLFIEVHAYKYTFSRISFLALTTVDFCYIVVLFIERYIYCIFNTFHVFCLYAQHWNAQNSPSINVVYSFNNLSLNGFELVLFLLLLLL